MMEVRPLRSEADYAAALEAIEAFFETEPQPGSPEADRFDLLALVIADYERKHWAIEAPVAPDLLRVPRPDGAESAAAGGPRGAPGIKSGPSEILDRRRHLTLEQAWKLHLEWRLPADALIRPYPLGPG